MGAIVKGRGLYGYVDCSDLFSKGHSIERWHTMLGEQMRDATRAAAPVRTGRLKSSIALTSKTRTGSHSVSQRIAARANYAVFVHDGTTGPIWSSRPVDTKGRPYGKMGPMDGAGKGYAITSPQTLPFGSRQISRFFPGDMNDQSRISYSGFPTWAIVVSGQAPNPFFFNAMFATAARRGLSMRRISAFSRDTSIIGGW